jgi:hypothetical protein
VTYREKKIALVEERAAAAAQLREVAQVARTAIGAMQSAGEIFAIIAGASWMKTIDPEPCCGPKKLCLLNAEHYSNLVAKLTERLKGVPE